MNPSTIFALGVVLMALAGCTQEQPDVADTLDAADAISTVHDSFGDAILLGATALELNHAGYAFHEENAEGTMAKLATSPDTSIDGRPGAWLVYVQQDGQVHEVLVTSQGVKQDRLASALPPGIQEPIAWDASILNSATAWASIGAVPQLKDCSPDGFSVGWLLIGEAGGIWQAVIFVAGEDRGVLSFDGTAVATGPGRYCSQLPAAVADAFNETLGGLSAKKESRLILVEPSHPHLTYRWEVWNDGIQPVTFHVTVTDPSGETTEDTKSCNVHCTRTYRFQKPTQGSWVANISVAPVDQARVAWAWCAEGTYTNETRAACEEAVFPKDNP